MRQESLDIERERNDVLTRMLLGQPEIDEMVDTKQQLKREHGWVNQRLRLQRLARKEYEARRLKEEENNAL